MGGALTLAVMTGCGGSSNQTSTSQAPPAAATPVLSQMHTMATIGSTVDATNGDNNPYGLMIAPMTAGNVTAGDLVVCNFNDVNGVAGNGTTIEDLAPTAGAMPKRIAPDPSLQGCDALSPNPANGYIWAAAYTANDNPIFTPSGKLVSTLASSYSWMNPWGEIYAATGSTSASTGSAYGYGASSTSSTSWYITDAKDGSIVQAAVTANGTVFNTIATGFPVNLTSQYGILAPAGLSYNATTDTLYIVSSASNSIVAFKAVSTIPANGITVTANMMTMALSFSGPAASQASVVYSGTPLNAPVSSALLYNGNLVVGNTADNNMLEIDPVQKTVVGEKLVDPGNAGAIFGIVTSGSSVATQKIYFNDDNANSVVAISQ
jgi:hypothetical protein